MLCRGLARSLGSQLVDGDGVAGLMWWWLAIAAWLMGSQGEGQGSCGEGWGSCGEGRCSCGEGWGSCGERWGSCGEGWECTILYVGVSCPCSVVITKLDVLDTFKEIRIGVSYTLGGKPVEGMPGEANVVHGLSLSMSFTASFLNPHPLPSSTYTALQSQLQRVVVEYLTLPGWCTSTAGVTNFADLPQRAQDYVMKLQALVGVPSEHTHTTNMHQCSKLQVCSDD